ncbi:MAG TPA: SDR family oxidoreductase [Flavobacteriaceae bacterium]|nr:SDR family oxidoreductase [Flavobacteriaceae bacterium]|tara:strand:- start:1011 stop:1685 length:675 start_codon:yes stop_codon:yes gene_type:complete
MKTILVSGSSSGIGLAICEEAKKMGHSVIGISRNINSQATELGIRSYSVDVTNQNQINELVNNLTSENITIDILINNAGLLIKDRFRDTTDDTFKKVYDVNVFGLANLTRALLPIINRHGQVINITSVGGLNTSKKFPGLSAYASSKGALITLTEVLAEEYRSRPRFNCLALGSVKTKMLAEAFPGYEAKIMPDEMAKQILDFAFDENNKSNGEIITLDKGNLE